MSLWPSHAVPLPEMHVRLAGSGEQVYHLMARLEGARIMEQDDASAVAEFSIVVGRFTFTTQERVWFDRAGQRLIFEQMRSPFFGVRRAREVFALSPLSDDATLLKVTGTLYTDWGLLGWAVTRFLVRPVWARVEARHLRQFQTHCQELFGHGEQPVVG